MSNSNSMLNIAVRLTIICAVNVALLIIINFVTDPIIQNNIVKAEEKANKFLIKTGDRFEKKYFTSDAGKKDYYFEAYNSSNNLIGYIVPSFGSGYGGKFKIMTAFDPDLKIIGAKALENNETPGIGKKMENPDYMNKFIGTNTPDKPFPFTKNMLLQEDADSVTGATITFKGITGAIRKAINMMKEELKK